MMQQCLRNAIRPSSSPPARPAATRSGLTHHRYPSRLWRRRQRPAAQRRSQGPLMRILIATDAWHPQVNGVVRTLTSLAASARRLGVEVDFLTPEGFPSFPVPTYQELRCALPSLRAIARRIEQAQPDAIHIATEGTIGYLTRRYCLQHGFPFTTSYTTRFPEYISVRSGISESCIFYVHSVFTAF